MYCKILCIFIYLFVLHINEYTIKYNDTKTHVGTLLCSSCICVLFHSFHRFYMDVCNDHHPPSNHHSPPVSDSGWNPNYHCCDNLHTRDRERFDNSLYGSSLFCGYI